MNYTIPALMLLTFIIALCYKVPLFDSFVQGTTNALKLVINILPYLIAIFIAIELMRTSGLSAIIGKFCAPIFNLMGIPKELSELLILRPLSGSGSLAVLEVIYKDYGADSYIGRSASVIMGSSDTIMYIVAVYFSTSKTKKTGLAIPISIFASIVGAAIACLICKIL